uniref:Uncharacterized protein n=1 Tax=Rhizophora mucronata TaxID=61149 RepID=A0A2P2QEZ1_RHIMU
MDWLIAAFNLYTLKEIICKIPYLLVH